jgi:aerobic-type carbon monoxide dehydrogenase small subunit (CoxS/CutS family)
MTRLILNGTTVQTDADPGTPLLYVLREDFRLNGAKYGCGLGQCGACTVLLDNQPVFSCITPLAVVDGKHVRTIEGLGTVENPGPVQRAFIEEQAAQCGYCIPGMMMRAQGLLEQNRTPTDADIREHMQPNLCRCGTHMRILRAVRRAATLAAGQ